MSDFYSQLHPPGTFDPMRRPVTTPVPDPPDLAAIPPHVASITQGGVTWEFKRWEYLLEMVALDALAFNRLGQQGWELAAISDNCHIFKRPVMDWCS